MKKIILTFSMAAFLYGCSSNSTKEETTSTNDTLVVKEIIVNDSLTTVMQKAKENIDKKSEELDELLNDL